MDPLTQRARELLAEWYKPIPPHRVVTYTAPLTSREEGDRNYALLERELDLMDVEHRRQ